MFSGRKFRSARSKPLTEDTSGIALFMVMAAVSVLALLVSEFTYIAQISQTLAFNSLDQVKAHYLAKSGLKLSMLRLKAYQQVKAVVGGGSSGGGASGPAGASSGGGGGIPGVPKAVLEKIWSFPFLYPIPTEIPGLSPGDKELIEKFQKESGLDGKFTAVIESESAKFNLNSILAPFAAPSPTPSGTAPPPPPPPPAPNAPPGTSVGFDANQARQNLSDYLSQILQHKFDEDADFASEYRDFKMEDFVDVLSAWTDPSYERKNQGARETVALKRAPFYTLDELHMVPMLDEELYNLFAPSLTVSTTGGINLNTMSEATLKGLVPNMTADEVKEFFKFRDDPEEDNAFKAEDDFYTYLLKNVNYFRNDKVQVDQFKNALAKKSIRLITDETEFKITVRAEVNHTVRVIEAWVSVSPTAASGGPGGTGAKTGTPPPPPGSPPPLAGPGGTANKPDSGIRVTFMRVL